MERARDKLIPCHVWKSVEISLFVADKWLNFVKRKLRSDVYGAFVQVKGEGG